jgi:hypothetical protein
MNKKNIFLNNLSKRFILKTFAFFVISLFVFQANAQTIEMSGKIVDSETKKQIEFVNIGILNKNKGTVSNLKGAFTLSVSKSFSKDSLTICHISYNTLKIPIENFKNRTLSLTPKTNELAEVIVSNKKKKQRKIGVRTYNPLLWLRAISEDKDIVENAQYMNIPDKVVKVKYVNIYFRRGFDVDSSYVRVNFYKNVDNKPGDRIFFENIMFKQKIEPGWLKLDLNKHGVFLEEDFFVGIEFIPDFDTNSYIYIGAILTKGKGFQRSNSQGSWSQIDGASTINIEIEY